MPARSVIEQLPPEEREWLESELVQRGFAGYIDLTEELNRRLAEQGLAISISKSSVHRFGQTVEDRIRAIKRTTEIAKTLTREAGDDEGVMSDALMRLLQDRLFHLTLDLELPEDVDIYKLGRVVAELGRASVQAKKHMIDERQRVESKLKEMETDATAGKRHLDPETLRRVREELYGLS